MFFNSVLELKLRRIAVIGYVAYLAQSRAFSVARADMDRCVWAHSSSFSSSSSSADISLGAKKGQGQGRGRSQEGDDDGQDDGDEGEGEMSDRAAREDSETARDDTLMDADDIIDSYDHDNGGGDGDGGTRARARAVAGASVRAGGRSASSTVHRTMSRAGPRDGPSSEGVEDKEQADRLVYHMLQQVNTAIYLQP